MRITSVSFYCVNRSTWDETLISEASVSQPETYDSYGPGHEGAVTQPSVYEHPCTSIKKLLSTGTFYFAKGGTFDLSTRLDKRQMDMDKYGTASGHDISRYDGRFVWNNYMIEPLINFRERLDRADRSRIDAGCFLLLAIQGFVGTFEMNLADPTGTAPAASSATGGRGTGTLALISRLSWKRAGTRFNTRGVSTMTAMSPTSSNLKRFSAMTGSPSRSIKYVALYLSSGSNRACKLLTQRSRSHVLVAPLSPPLIDTLPI